MKWVCESVVRIYDGACWLLSAESYNHPDGWQPLFSYLNSVGATADVICQYAEQAANQKSETEK